MFPRILILTAVVFLSSPISIVTAEDYDRSKALNDLQKQAVKGDKVEKEKLKAELQKEKLKTDLIQVKRALAHASNLHCDCGECTNLGKPIPMPTLEAIVPQKPVLTKYEILGDYTTLLQKVKGLKGSDSVRVFSGTDVLDDLTYTGTVYWISEIPGNKAGVYRCWNDPKTLKPTMQEIPTTTQSFELSVVPKTP